MTRGFGLGMLNEDMLREQCIKNSERIIDLYDELYDESARVNNAISLYASALTNNPPSEVNWSEVAIGMMYILIDGRLRPELTEGEKARGNYECIKQAFDEIIEDK